MSHAVCVLFSVLPKISNVIYNFTQNRFGSIKTKWNDLTLSVALATLVLCFCSILCCLFFFSSLSLVQRLAGKSFTHWIFNDLKQTNDKSLFSRKLCMIEFLVFDFIWQKNHKFSWIIIYNSIQYNWLAVDAIIHRIHWTDLVNCSEYAKSDLFIIQSHWKSWQLCRI